MYKKGFRKGKKGPGGRRPAVGPGDDCKGKQYRGVRACARQDCGKLLEGRMALLVTMNAYFRQERPDRGKGTSKGR